MTVAGRVALLACAAVLGACDGQPASVEPPPSGAGADGETGAAPEVGAGPSDDDPGVAGDPDAGDDPEGPVEVAVTEVATDLEAPWAVAFLDGRTFVTERDRGRLVELDDDGEAQEVRTFDVDPTGEGGLLGLAADPGGGRLHAYLTTGPDNRVVRFDPDGGDEEVVLDGIPAAANHDGGRLAFGPDGMLHVATGDAQQPGLARDPGSLAGKILRVTPDGDVPDDNPEAGSPVWSLGHRNVQGLAFDAEGRLFAAEFGPDRDDEINRIEPGADHGWPEVTGEAGVEGLTDPVVVRPPGDASWSGGVVLVDGAIPQWEGDLFVAALRGERLHRIPLEDGEVVGEPEELLVGDHGRLRDVTQAPDGSLWVLTNNRDGRGVPRAGDDRILRLGPG